MKSQNYTAKFRLPVGETWNFTAFATNNHNKWNNTDNPGGTPAQIALYGKDFLLSNDPTKATYKGYNIFRKNTTFGYLKAEGDLPLDFKFENTLYLSYYDNTTNTASNLTSVDGTTNAPGAIGGYLTNSLTVNGVTTTNKPSHPNAILGYEKLNHYMTWGNITRANRDFSFGTLHTGMWLERARTNRHTYDYAYDPILGKVADNREKAICLTYAPQVGTAAPKCLTTSTDASLNSKSYEEQSAWWQVQVYTDLAWNVTDKLTVTPGVKWVSMKRDVTAEVIKSPRQAQNASNKNTDTLKNLTVNYKLAKNWSVYGQYAEGSYMPDIAALYVINPSTNTADPSLSTNYQFGTVYQTKHIAVDFDFYRIDLTNLLAPDAAVNTYVNIGKAKAKGVEGQISYTFDNGITLYANGSSNDYIDAYTRFQVSGAPQSTRGFGALYNHKAWDGSLFYKQIGTQWADNVQAVRIAPYDTTDLSVNYTFGHYRLKAQVNNIQDNQPVVAIKTNSNPALSTYGYLVGRNAQLTLIAKF
jgi:iron complex outermembrane recepter protein